MTEAYVTGAARTAFGRLEGETALSLMRQASLEAIESAGLNPSGIDGVLTGYSMTHPHLMLANVVAENLAIQPSYAHAVSLGGATGAAMVQLASLLVAQGICENVLVTAADVRLSGADRHDIVNTLAGVGHPEAEVPTGLTIPGYYALLASRYLAATTATKEEMAFLAVLMRNNAAATAGAHLTRQIDVEDVLSSPMVADPLTRYSCCPISDGGAALVISKKQPASAGLRIAGGGQAHQHQHISNLDWNDNGSNLAATRAFASSHIAIDDIGMLLIYDSFTVTLATLLEDIGIVPNGQAGRLASQGYFDRAGDHPLNPHGGLLSYGHSGVAGGMSHLVEAYLQVCGQVGDRQANTGKYIYAHGDGGVMSSHVGLVFEVQK